MVARLFVLLPLFVHLNMHSVAGKSLFNQSWHGAQPSPAPGCKGVEGG
jgi:hypothetical protein